MNIFAKVIEVPDREMVLVRKDYDPENERYGMVIARQPADVSIELTAWYRTAADRDKYFDEYSIEHANNFLDHKF